jgi:hypothetical protein
MGISRRKVLSQFAAVAALVSLAQGCAWFNLSNPLLPSARLVAQPNPSEITVKMSYSSQQQTVTVTPTDVKVHVQSYQNDGTPGVYFHSYSAEYFDLAGKPIPSVLLSKANFGISQYILPATSTKASSIDLDLPIYNQQVKLYGVEQAYSFAGGPSLNPNFSHTINARVTLYGEDDNFNQVQYSLNVPIKFDAEITQ